MSEEKKRYQRVRPRRKTREEQFKELGERISKINELIDSTTDPREVRRYVWISECLTLRWMSMYNRLHSE